MNAKEFVNEFYDVPNTFEDDDYDKGAINECNFSSYLRCKYGNSDIESDDTISIEWCSQEWDDPDDFFREVGRCYRYLAKVNNLEEPINVKVKIFDRDGEESSCKVIRIEVPKHRESTIEFVPATDLKKYHFTNDTGHRLTKNSGGSTRFLVLSEAFIKKGKINFAWAQAGYKGALIFPGPKIPKDGITAKLYYDRDIDCYKVLTERFGWCYVDCELIDEIGKVPKGYFEEK